MRLFLSFSKSLLFFYCFKSGIINIEKVPAVLATFLSWLFSQWPTFPIWILYQKILSSSLRCACSWQWLPPYGCQTKAYSENLISLSIWDEEKEDEKKKKPSAYVVQEVKCNALAKSCSSKSTKCVLRISPVTKEMIYYLDLKETLDMTLSYCTVFENIPQSLFFSTFTSKSKKC